MENKKVTIENLTEYIEARKTNPNLSVNDYVGGVADLSGIIFNQEIDLSGANLSCAKLDGVNFNQFVTLKGASLQGASLENTKFTGWIDLAGVDFGQISLNKNMFTECKLDEANLVTITQIKKIKEIKVSDKLIEEYLKSDEKSLSKYLENKYKQIVIADLANIEIDSRFNNKDLSNCKFVGTIFKGKITDLILRDCFFEQIKPTEGCVLINPDLRGTSLAEQTDNSLNETISFDLYNTDAVNNWGFSSINSKHHMVIKDPILSIGSDEHLRNYLLNGSAKLEPCYKKGTETKELRHIHQYNLDTILKKTKIEGHDFADLDLRNIDLVGKEFINCNFADAKLSGVKADGVTFSNCSFYGTDFSSKIAGWWYKAASFTNAKFKDCDFTYADLTGVNATSATFENLTAININAAGFRIPILNNRVNNLKLDKVSADGANFSGANMPELSARSLKAERINFSAANCRNVDFTGSNLQYANFYNANLQRAQLERSNISYARFAKAKAGQSRWIDVIADDCSIAGMFEEPEIFDIDIEKLIKNKRNYELNTRDLNRKKANNLNKTYDNFMLGLVGLSVAAAIATPLMLSGTTALAAGLVLDKIAFIAIIAFAADKISQNEIVRTMIGERFSKKIADFLNISPIIERSHNIFKATTDEKIKQNEKEIARIAQASSRKFIQQPSRKTHVEKLREATNQKSIERGA